MSNAHSLRRLIVAIAIALVVIGALWFGSYTFLASDAGGRWDRYANGGSYIGCRPSASLARSEIVYSSPRTGHGDIYLVNLDGTGGKQLTSDLNYEGDPTWSTDGDKIAFVREAHGGAAIWIMNRDGTHQIQITGCDGCYDSWPSFSTDGSEIVFSRSRRQAIGAPPSRDLYIIHLATRDERRLTFGDPASWQPCFVPSDEDVLYCVYSDEIRLLDHSTLRSRRIGSGGSPAISSDGALIAFVKNGSRRFSHEIFTMDIRGNSITQVTCSGGYKSDPTFLSDRRHVVFLREGSSFAVGEIIAVVISNGHERVITKAN